MVDCFTHFEAELNLSICMCVYMYVYVYNNFIIPQRTVQERAAKKVVVCELFIPGKILHFIKPSRAG